MAQAPPIGEILVQPDQLKERVKALGIQIADDYDGLDVLLVGVLKGAMFFLSDLLALASERGAAMLDVGDGARAVVEAGVLRFERTPRRERPVTGTKP